MILYILVTSGLLGDWQEWTANDAVALTFGILLYGYQANEVEFQTSWFIESALTGLILMRLVRTQRPCFQSRPGPLLTTALLTIGAIVIY